MSDQGLNAGDVARLLASRRHQGSGHPRPAAAAAWMHALRSLHDQFAAGLASQLTATLRKSLDAKLTSVSSHAYRDFVRSLETPNCLGVVQGGSDRLLLAVSPTVLFPMIDRLLGGGSEPTPIVRRPFTEIELRLVNHLMSLTLTELRAAWAQRLSANLSLERIETNPQQLSGIPAAESVVRLDFQLALEESRGTLTLCLPIGIAERLTVETPVATPIARTAEGLSPEPALQRVGLVEVAAHLAETPISATELLGLRPGDIIATTQEADAPLVVSVGGVPKFHARAGALQGRKAFQVDGAIESAGGGGR